MTGYGVVVRQPQNPGLVEAKVGENVVSSSSCCSCRKESRGSSPMVSGSGYAVHASSYSVTCAAEGICDRILCTLDMFQSKMVLLEVFQPSCAPTPWIFGGLQKLKRSVVRSQSETGA